MDFIYREGRSLGEGLGGKNAKRPHGNTHWYRGSLFLEQMLGLSVSVRGGYYLLAIVEATFATNAMSKGGGIAMLAAIGLHGVEPVSAGKSAKVAAGAGLSFLRYCHSGADNSLNLKEIPILFRFSLRSHEEWWAGRG